MGLTEGMQLVSSRTEGHISSQVVESRGPEKKAMLEQELSVTPSDKGRCFACHDTSHNLKQCGIKYNHTTVPHQFGYATKYPFTMIQPSEETVEKEKFNHHCVLITSDLSNLDQGILKSELQKFWKLSGDWELRRECSKSFLASFSSEDDVISCLNFPEMEALLDHKEVNLTVTRWEEGDEESLDLIEEWVLVRGVRRIYRNWKDLYQVASAFGVLIDVDEKSLEAGDKEPIRLKIALRSLDGAPFSYYFALGRSSRLVMVTVVQDKAEGMQQQNKESDKEHNKELNDAQSIFLEESRLAGEIKGNKISAPAATTAITKKTTMDSSKPEEVQPVGRSSTSMIGEEHFEGEQAQIFFF